jgi:hypothetical protein
MTTDADPPWEYSAEPTKKTDFAWRAATRGLLLTMANLTQAATVAGERNTITKKKEGAADRLPIPKCPLAIPGLTIIHTCLPMLLWVLLPIIQRRRTKTAMDLLPMETFLQVV